jgi:hypothetical protein
MTQTGSGGVIRVSQPVRDRDDGSVIFPAAWSSPRASRRRRRASGFPTRPGSKRLAPRRSSSPSTRLPGDLVTRQASELAGGAVEPIHRREQLGLRRVGFPVRQRASATRSSRPRSGKAGRRAEGSATRAELPGNCRWAMSLRACGLEADFAASEPPPPPPQL